MKGYDACVFPREGEPVLICLEASAEDAARTAWTTDVRFVRGYDEDDPRPPCRRARSTPRSRRARSYGRVGLELSLGTQASDRMVGEPTTFTQGAGSTRGPDAQDATPLLDAARAIKTAQEIERMRLANEICAAAMEHVRGELRPGMKESEAAAIWQGFVHGEGTGWHGQVELALGFSLVWSGAGIKTFTATGDRPVQADEPTLFEIWVCADGYWADHTKLRLPRRAARRLPRARGGAAGRLRPRDRPLPPGREPRRSSTGWCATGIAAIGLPGAADASDLPRRRRARARAAVRAPGRRRRDRGGHGARDRAGLLLGGRRRLARRGQLPDHERGRREALALPGRSRACLT